MAAALLASCALLRGWTTSVEFPFTALPRTVWERELAHLKEMGVAHVSLPVSGDAGQLDGVVRIVRRLGLEADLEGPVPARMETLEKAHGGPLNALPDGAVRISAIMPRALDNERKLLTSGTQAVVWTDAFETIGGGYHAGAITMAGDEGEGAAVIRREAQLARYWGATFSQMPESAGARLSVPVDGISIRQFTADKPVTAAGGPSLVAVVNDTADTWNGEVRVMYPAMQRPILVAGVGVKPHDVVWLPVNVPLTRSANCAGCDGFAPTDHLAYATAELTGMEYENGVLAMEFIARSAGEAVLQLSHEPPGPLIAGAHPTVFDWDPKTMRARLPIPAGNAKTGRVRVALAIDAPPATAFFTDATVLLAGETTRLTAEFSPADVAARSRVRTATEVTVTREEPAAPPPIAGAVEDKSKPAMIGYRVTVPASAIEGDVIPIAIEADGGQLSHAQLPVLKPVAVSFADAVSVRLAAGSSMVLKPATIPVEQKRGREIAVKVRNNAPEIRTFEVTCSVPGLEFSPAKVTVSVGASLEREVTFRVFSTGAEVGVHAGTVRITGASSASEPVRIAVLPGDGSIVWSADGFSILESAKRRASFLGTRWLEMIDKESGKDSQPAGGTVWNGGPVETLRLEDLAGGGARR